MAFSRVLNHPTLLACTQATICSRARRRRRRGWEARGCWLLAVAPAILLALLRLATCRLAAAEDPGVATGGGLGAHEVREGWRAAPAGCPRFFSLAPTTPPRAPPGMLAVPDVAEVTAGGTNVAQPLRLAPMHALGEAVGERERQAGVLVPGGRARNSFNKHTAASFDSLSEELLPGGRLLERRHLAEVRESGHPPARVPSQAPPAPLAAAAGQQPQRHPPPPRVPAPPVQPVQVSAIAAATSSLPPLLASAVVELSGSALSNAPLGGQLSLVVGFSKGSGGGGLDNLAELLGQESRVQVDGPLPGSNRQEFPLLLQADLSGNGQLAATFALEAAGVYRLSALVQDANNFTYGHGSPSLLQITPVLPTLLIPLPAPAAVAGEEARLQFFTAGGASGVALPDPDDVLT
eukprot:jgi/Mesen1/9860/ME000070S09147